VFPQDFDKQQTQSPRTRSRASPMLAIGTIIVEMPIVAIAALAIAAH